MSISLTRGDDYSGARQLVVAVTDEAGVPVDLTGTVARFMVKTRRADADEDAVIDKMVTLAADQEVDTGIAFIELTSEDTDALTARSYHYEIEAEDVIGLVTLAAGRILVTADLIRGSV